MSLPAGAPATPRLPRKAKTQRIGDALRLWPAEAGGGYLAK